jgi:hypothetical protein
VIENIKMRFQVRTRRFRVQKAVFSVQNEKKIAKKFCRLKNSIYLCAAK